MPQTFLFLIPLHISLYVHSSLSLLCISSFSFPTLSTFCFSQPVFSTQKMSPSVCSFLCTIILINCSTFLYSGVARETAGKTRSFETTIQKTKRKKENSTGGKRSGVLTPVWECRWAGNACCEKLETMKLMDRRIRLDEYKGRAKPQICGECCTEMDRIKNTSKGSSKE